MIRKNNEIAVFVVTAQGMLCLPTLLLAVPFTRILLTIANIVKYGRAANGYGS